MSRARKEFEDQHTVYHEYRLWVACNLMATVVERQVRSPSTRTPVFLEAGVGMGMTLYVFSSWLANIPDQRLNSAFRNSQYIGLDTFEGIDLSLITPALRKRYRSKTVPYGGTTLDVAHRRFSHLPNVSFVKGSIPAILEQVSGIQPDWLHIDLNNPAPEVATLRSLVPNMTKGSMVLLDDYGFQSARDQFEAANQVLSSMGFQRPITLPTGQGLLLI